MLDRERFAGAAHAGHDFVGDEKNSSIAADFCDAFCVAVRRGGCTECGSDDGFEDKGRNGGCVVCGEERFEVVGAGEFAVWECFAKGTAIAKTGCDVAPLWQERLIRGAASEVAADGHGSEGAAMVALAARNHPEFLQGAGFEMTWAGKFDGGLGSFGATGGEVDTAVGEIWRREGEEAGSEFFG